MCLNFEFENVKCNKHSSTDFILLQLAYTGDDHFKKKQTDFTQCLLLLDVL